MTFSEYSVCLASLITVFVTSAQASERRQLDAHVHGVTTLNIVQEDEALMLEITAPAMNIVGFEHAPSTDEHQEAISNALAALESGDELFGINEDAECSFNSAKASHVMDDGHDEDHHHDKDHHEDEDHGAGGHAEFTSELQFTCNEPDELEEINVKLFGVFSLTEEVEASFIGPMNQTFSELSPDRAVFRVAP